MDTHSDHPKDLNDLERRLSAWQPSSDGLDADAVLFAAGRASSRSSTARFVWPALTSLLTVLTVILSLKLASERDKRSALARRLSGDPPPAPSVNPLPPPAANPSPVQSSDPDELPPDSYLASRRALEKGLDVWPCRVVVRSGPPDPSSADPPVLRLGQRDALLDP